MKSISFNDLELTWINNYRVEAESNLDNDTGFVINFSKVSKKKFSFFTFIFEQVVFDEEGEERVFLIHEPETAARFSTSLAEAKLKGIEELQNWVDSGRYKGPIVEVLASTSH